MTVEVPLTKGLVAVVDDEDAEIASSKWYSLRDGGRNGSSQFIYAVRVVKNPKKSMQSMHRLVAFRAGMQVDGKEVDHINGDRLDNRRLNLRVTTRSENMRNQRTRCNSVSGFKGVCWHRVTGKWSAGIRHLGKRIHIGLFDDVHVAADAYDRAAARIHGEFASLNFASAGGR